MTISSFTAPVDGTKDNEYGTDGSVTYTYTLTKDNYTSAAQGAFTTTLKAVAYESTEEGGNTDNPDDPQWETYAVSGKVSDFQGGSNTLSGITVNLYAATDTTFKTTLGTATTDASGNFNIDNEVADGSYVVRIAANSGKYAESKSDVTVNGAAVTNADITLVSE